MGVFWVWLKSSLFYIILVTILRPAVKLMRERKKETNQRNENFTILLSNLGVYCSTFLQAWLAASRIVSIILVNG